jgi:hypothetical protein
MCRSQCLDIIDSNNTEQSDHFYVMRKISFMGAYRRSTVDILGVECQPMRGILNVL